MVTDQHRGWIRTVILCGVLSYAAVCVTLVLSGDNATDVFFRQEFYITGVLLAAMVIERRGHGVLAAGISLAAVWMEVHVSFMLHDGPSSASTVIPAWVVAVGALLGGRAGLIAGIVSGLSSVCAYAAGGWLGLSRGVLAQDMPFHITTSVATMATGAMVAALQRSVRAAFSRLEEDARRSRDLLDALPIGVVAVSPGGEVTACNPRAQNILSSGHELPGQHLRQLPLRRDGEALERLAPGTFEARVAERDGAVVEATVLPWAESQDEGADQLLLLLRDVTEERAAREREDELHRQLNHSQRMEAIGLLAGGVAHDFNNLLTVIGGNATLLTEIDDPDVYEPARDMLLAQQQGAALARRLLTFARKDVVSPRALDLAAEIQTSLPLLRRLVGEQVSIDVALDSAWVLLDPGQLEQVLFNVAANARDAMAPDGGRLFLASQSAGDRTILEVRDSGAGMSAEVRDRLFEPFFSTKGADGTGLGLATVHGIVQRSHGDIKVESAPGEGTTFRVCWPATAEPSDVAPDATIETERPVGRGGEVLLVEDSDGARRSLARLLEHAGYEVIQAARGDHALALLGERGAAPSIVVTDLHMPGMSGIDLAERLDRLYPDLPVVIMSGYIDDALRVQARSRHREIMFKPFNGDDLVARIEGELTRAAAASARIGPRVLGAS